MLARRRARPRAREQHFIHLGDCHAHVAVGEESGDLEEMLEVVAGVYDDGVDSVSATFSAVIEPLMIGVLGAVVGGLVLSLYLPMFRLVDIVQ